MKALKIIGVILALAFIIDYWQWFLIAGLCAGAVHLWNERRKAHKAEIVARPAKIAELERDLGI